MWGGKAVSMTAEADPYGADVFSAADEAARQAAATRRWVELATALLEKCAASIQHMVASTLSGTPRIVAGGGPPINTPQPATQVPGDDGPALAP
jgi:hypothetical protein